MRPVRPREARDRMRAQGGSRWARIVLVSLVCLGLGGSGCATSDWVKRWRGESAKRVESIPLPANAVSLANLEADLAKGPFEEADRRSLTRLSQLADIFYQRLAHRRLNSIATFHDPALREFFRSEEAFADYYADLVQDLGESNFEANRPERIELRSLHVEDSANRAVAVVHFVGDNSLPLRFWSVSYARRDVWERANDRWWIIPGKL